MHHFLGHDFFQKLSATNFPGNDFAIAGSGPLFARDWIEDPGDLDVVTRGQAWQIASKLGSIEAAPYSTTLRVRLFDGQIEVLNGWFPERWNTDDLIDQADVIMGVRFVTLNVVIETKRLLAQPRDLLHLKVIADRLGMNTI